MLINMPEAHKQKRIDNMNVVDHILEHRFETLMPRFHCRVRYGSVRLSPVGREGAAQLSSEVAFPPPTVPLMVGRMSIAAAAT